MGARWDPAGRGARLQTGGGLLARPAPVWETASSTGSPVKSASPGCGPRWGATAFETPVLLGQGWAGGGPVLAWDIYPGFPNRAFTEQFHCP